MGKETGEEGEKEKEHVHTGREKMERGQKETKMFGLCRRASWGPEARVGTEECWENLEARPALIGKVCSSAPCQGSFIEQIFQRGE